MSNIPQGNDQWAQEAIETLVLALKLLEEDQKRPVTDQNKQELYKYAPVLAAYNRKVDDRRTVSEMAQYAFEKRLADDQLDSVPNGKEELTFFLAYLEAHVPLEVIEESDIQPIMEEVINQLAA